MRRTDVTVADSKALRGDGAAPPSAVSGDPPWTKLSREIEGFLAEAVSPVLPEQELASAPPAPAEQTPATRRVSVAKAETETETDDLVGGQIGHYDVMSCLGKGGMGIVYRCRHRLVHSHVAIKVLNEDVSDPTAFERFVREARAANAIESPHVVPIVDFGRLPDGRPFAVMAQLVGESLETRCAARGPLPLSEVAEICRQTALGMAAAHRAGILHRDLKPANLFLEKTSDGDIFVRLLDFGVCKIVEYDDESARLTTRGFCVGTPQFCSPEQATAGAVTEATDIYSLGAVAYELLSGTPTFEGSSVDLMVRKNLEDPISIGARCPSLPVGVIALITEMLDRRPSARPRSMEEVADRFATFAHTEARVPSSPAEPSPTEPSVATLPEAKRSEPSPAVHPVVPVLLRPPPTATNHVVGVLRAEAPRRSRAWVASLVVFATVCSALVLFVGHVTDRSFEPQGEARSISAALPVMAIAIRSDAEPAGSSTGVALPAPGEPSLGSSRRSAAKEPMAGPTSTQAYLPSRSTKPSKQPSPVVTPPSRVTTPAERAKEPARAAPTSSPLVDPFQ